MTVTDPSGRLSISGRVRDGVNGDGDGVISVVITATPQDGAAALSAVTDGDGFYTTNRQNLVSLRRFRHAERAEGSPTTGRIARSVLSDSRRAKRCGGASTPSGARRTSGHLLAPCGGARSSLTISAATVWLRRQPRWEFYELPAGTYTLRASKTWSGFEPSGAEPAHEVTILPVAHGVDFRRVSQVMGADRPTIFVELPNGGEEWEVDTTHTIAWSSFEFASDVKIELSRDGGATYSVLFANTADDGQERWAVTGPAAGNAKVRVRTVDGSATDVSDAVFTIGDLILPELTVPADVTAEQTSGDGTAVDIGQATATDNADPNPEVTNDAPAVFPLDETVVTGTATDDSGNVSSVAVTLVVEDTVAPTVFCPADITVEPETADGTVVAFAAEANDTCDAEVELAYDPASGSVFPSGTTTVTVTATDDSANQSQCQFTVTVEDTTAPDVTATLKRVGGPPPWSCAKWGKFRVGADATDICDAQPDVTAVMVAPDPTGYRVRYVRSRVERIVFTRVCCRRTILLMGRNRGKMEARLQEIRDQGGVLVANGQRLTIRKKPGCGALKAVFMYRGGKLHTVVRSDPTLRLTAVDDSGNEASAEAKPDSSRKKRPKKKPKK